MKYTHLILFSLFAISACKKDDATEPPTPELTPTEYLTSGKWQMVNIKEQKKENGTVNESDITKTILKDCNMDDYSIYSSTGKVVAHYDGVKCSSNEVAVDSSSTWSMTDKILSVRFYLQDSSVVTQPFTVSEINGSSLVLIQDMNFSASNGRQRIFTYKNIK